MTLILLLVLTVVNTVLLLFVAAGVLDVRQMVGYLNKELGVKPEPVPDSDDPLTRD